jgi:hypothetical protein
MEKVALVLAGSTVVLVQTISHYHRNDFYFIWALFVSLTGVVLSALSLLLLLLKKEETKAFMKYIVLLLFIVWIAGTSVLTMKGPYTQTGNGYFGAWLALVMSWLLAIDYLPLAKEHLGTLCKRGNEAVQALTLASLTIFVQTLWNLSDGRCPRVGRGPCSGEVIWTLACSGVSLVVCVLLHAPDVASKVQPHFRFIALFFMVWWSAGFFIATFDAPYVLTGNGFFGCWVALLASMSLFDNTWGLNPAAGAVRKVPIELLGLFLGSLVVLIAATYERNVYDFWTCWTAICSSVSLIVTVVLLIMMGGELSSNMGSYLPSTMLFLAGWWAVGTFLMTFFSPFTATSNGYFGAWIALVSALLLCQVYSDNLKALVGKVGERGPGLAILALASVTVLLQAFVDVIKILTDSKHQVAVRGNLVWAIVGSGLSLVICYLVANFSAKVSDGFKWITLGLTMLWGFCVSLLTFEGPYTMTGNAYFSCWVGLAASVFMLSRAFPAVTQRVRDVRMEQPQQQEQQQQQAPAAPAQPAAPQGQEEQPQQEKEPDCEKGNADLRDTSQQTPTQEAPAVIGSSTNV